MRKPKISKPWEPALSPLVVDRFVEYCKGTYEIWQTLLALFGDRQKAEMTIKSPFPHFFQKVRDAFVASFQLHIARLHDDHVVQGRINLTYSYILTFGGWDKETRKKLNEQLKKMSYLYGRIKKARNKYFAHNDLEAYIHELRLGGYKAGKDKEYFDHLEVFLDIVQSKTIRKSFKFPDVAKIDGEAFFDRLVSAKLLGSNPERN